MSPTDKFLARFLIELKRWEDRIRRACYAKDVVFCRSSSGIDILVRWNNRNGTVGELKKTFTLKDLLGHTQGMNESSWVPEKRPCACAREVISAVLNHRGV